MANYGNRKRDWFFTDRITAGKGSSLSTGMTMSSLIFKDEISEYSEKIEKWKAASMKIKDVKEKNIQEEKSKQLECDRLSKIARGADGRVKRLLKIEPRDKISEVKSNIAGDTNERATN